MQPVEYATPPGNPRRKARFRQDSAIAKVL
jgi:hypothetical protein